MFHLFSHWPSELFYVNIWASISKRWDRFPLNLAFLPASRWPAPPPSLASLLDSGFPIHSSYRSLRNPQKVNVIMFLLPASPSLKFSNLIQVVGRIHLLCLQDRGSHFLAGCCPRVAPCSCSSGPSHKAPSMGSSQHTVKFLSRPAGVVLLLWGLLDYIRLFQD